MQTTTSNYINFCGGRYCGLQRFLPLGTMKVQMKTFRRHQSGKKSELFEEKTNKNVEEDNDSDNDSVLEDEEDGSESDGEKDGKS